MPTATTPDLDLDQLLSPVSTAAFFVEHWEKQPLLLRKGTGAFAGLLSREEADRLLSTPGLRYPYLTMVYRCSPLALERYTTTGGAIDSQGVADAFAEGCTAVLAYADQISPPLSALCRRLESAFGRHVWANVYTTPPSSEGLLPHYDTYDLFVLQIAGSKTWRIRQPPIEQPMSTQICEPPNGVCTEELQVSTLREGDLLYLPRGYVHEPYTTDESSIHASIVISPHTWRDVLAEILPDVLESIALDDVRFRRSPPMGPDSGGPAGRRVRENLDDLLEALSRRVAEATTRHLAQGRLLGQPAPQILAAADERSLERLGPQSRVRMRPGLDASIAYKGDLVTIGAGGLKVMGPKHIEPMLRYILKAGELTVDSIPGSLPIESKLVLVRRLMREGFLVECAQDATR